MSSKAIKAIACLAILVAAISIAFKAGKISGREDARTELKEFFDDYEKELAGSLHEYSEVYSKEYTEGMEFALKSVSFVNRNFIETGAFVR